MCVLCTCACGLSVCVLWSCVCVCAKCIGRCVCMCMGVMSVTSEWVRCAGVSS